MGETTINNITQNDFERQQIRIRAHQKELFPAEERGFPKNYNVVVTWEHKSYKCTYRIGSKDGKARSGVLRLEDGLAEALGNKVGMALVLKKTGNNEYQLTAARL